MRKNLQIMHNTSTDYVHSFAYYAQVMHNNDIIIAVHNLQIYYT